MSFDRLLTISGIVLTLLGFPLAYYWGRSAIRDPKLRAAVQTNVLMDSNGEITVPEISITHNGKEVERISRTVLAIWNAGSGSLPGQSITTSDPLRLKFDGQVFQSSIYSTSRDAVNFGIDLDKMRDHCVRIQFDFLDPGDGAVIEVLHEGEGGPTLVGTVRGTSLPRLQRADLSGDALRIVPMRYISRLRGRISRRSKYFFALAIAYVIVLAAILVESFHRLKSRALVDVNGYDLTTLDGQSAFAKTVSKMSSPITDIAMVGSALAFFVAFMIYAAYRIAHRKIPASILATPLRGSLQ